MNAKGTRIWCPGYYFARLASWRFSFEGLLFNSSDVWLVIRAGDKSGPRQYTNGSQKISQ
jgi:hypothetical protein